MARLRELAIGWLRTISALDERSFPIGIKNINLKELAVIFPLSMVAIAFVFRNIMISMAALVPVIFIVFFEEKSMDEFQYVYYFLRFYLKELIKSEKKVQKKEIKQKQAMNIDIVSMIRKYFDYELIAAGSILSIISLPDVIKIFEFKALPPQIAIESAIVFSLGTGIAGGEAIYLLLKKRLMRKK